jgi:SanA protein
MRAARRFFVRAISVGGLAILGVLALVGTTNAWIARDSRPFIRTSQDAPARAVAIVPGAGVWRGQPGAFLEDRLKTALALYRAGSVRAILVSGNEAAGETTAMQRWLAGHGVGPDDVIVDPAGTRTLETAVRASQTFGVTSAIVCTQRGHMNRTLFLAREAGIDAVGVAGELELPSDPRFGGIEALKSTLAFVEVFALGNGRADTSSGPVRVASR